MKCLLIFAILALLIPSFFCKVYTKCELAKELYRLGLPKAQLPDWICLVNAESSCNTTKIHTNADSRKTKDWGLFQINDRYWCTDGSNGKDCSINCRNLINDNIADDVACAKKVYASKNNFTPWAAWNTRCKGKILPTVSECFPIIRN